MGCVAIRAAVMPATGREPQNARIGPGDPTKRAAQYIRMSTDAQDLSPEIQARAISAYAERNGLILVETYLDAGRSGLTLQRRPAMQKLLADVASDQCQFSVVLVYDISRWGRFQDTDASAYYEYHCRMHGVQVRYVQELFPECDSPLGAVLKNLKRAMAAEYSRELAVKTRAGQRAAVDSGFHIGGLPCLGVARVAVSKHDGAERPLGPHDHKAASREHVRWIRAPEEEVAVVRRIFRLYTTTTISVFKLGQQLRDEGITDAAGKPLTPWKLYSLLNSEALIGNFVWGREDHGRKRSEADDNFWRVSACIEPIVDLRAWQVAKAKRARRAGTIRSREELLAYLADAVRRNPRFTASDLSKCDGPSRQCYVKHFGSFAGALQCLGLMPAKPDQAFFANRRNACRLGQQFCAAMQEVLNQHGVDCRLSKPCSQLLLVGGRVRVRVQIIWRAPQFGVMQWSLRKVYRESFDHVFIVRLNEDDTVFDSILLTKDDYFSFQLWFGDDVPGTGFERIWGEQEVAMIFARLQAAAPRSRSRSNAALLGSARRAASVISALERLDLISDHRSTEPA